MNRPTPADDNPTLSHASSGGGKPFTDDEEAGASSVILQRSPKSNYARALQRTCDQALQRIVDQHVISTGEWAAPLTAAPSAISVMAVLLKTADARAAAGLTVSSLDVTDPHTGKVVGQLPSTYFHADLQYCADLGRLAFSAAQHGMNRIQTISRGMIGEGGRIALIIDLLEEPDDARHDLVPEIEAIKVSAKKCLDIAKDIAGRFTYWHLVILHLKQCSLERQGVVVLQQQALEESKDKSRIEQTEWAEKQLALEDKIAAIKAKLVTAEAEVQEAREFLKEVLLEPLPNEPSTIDNYKRVKSLIPDETLEPETRGLLVETWERWFGQSNSSVARQDKRQRDQKGDTERRRQELLDKDIEQWKQVWDAAERRLVRAVDDKAGLNRAMDEAHRELSLSRDRLAEAKASLERSKAQMEQFKLKALELKDIESILRVTSDQLGKLKKQVDPLVDFFESIIVGIDDGISENITAFLRPIERQLQENTDNPDELNVVNLGKLAKRSMMAAALQMQGRFSAIADISGAYITISSKYIRPAINRMEELSTCSDDEWKDMSGAFIKDCMAWSDDIDAFAQNATVQAKENIKSHMDLLQRRAIEAAG